MRGILCSLAFAALAAAAPLSLRYPSAVAAGEPVLFEGDLPASFHPQSLRVTAEGAPRPLAAKVEWRAPHARISWISTGAPAYLISEGSGSPPAPPAMIGTGDRVTYGRPGIRGPVAVGLWAHPAAFDFDGDGNIDLVVGCPDHPYNGTYLFHNIGTNAAPLFAPAEWLGPGAKDLVAADFNGDGRIDLVVSGGYYSDVSRNRMSRFVPVRVDRDYHVGRDDLWYPVDWDGDGRIDLLIGVSDWRDYGWDDAFDSSGRWTRGPLHGYVYFHRNTGSNERPVHARPVALEAGGKILDLYGSPSPNPVDWNGRGVLDLIGGSFLDRVTLFRNLGTRTAPRLDAGREFPFRMDLCMIQPRVVYWHPDGRPSLLIGEEDGTVSLVENLAPKGQEPRLAAPRKLE